MPPANLLPLDFSKTQRLVLLVDLHPCLILEDPTPYLRAVAAVASRLLRFPPLSTSLSAYRFFFSSLSPIRSAAVLPPHLSPSSISFNCPSQTLDSLSSSMNSISGIADWRNSPCARAAYTASSLLQLIHSRAWEKESDNLSGDDDGDLGKIPSSLVILISPISQSVSSLVDYLECRKFDEVFSCVRDAFVVRDIHLCCIDVKIDELKIKGADEKKNECGVKLKSLKNEIQKLGWGFCSSDFIVLGSALMPLGLIYPKIGLPFDFVHFGDLDNIQRRGEFSLEILDVNAKPLECKCCDLEFLSLQGLPSSIKTDDILNALESRYSQISHFRDSFWVHLGKENIRLLVKSIHRYEQSEKIRGSREIVLVRERFQDLGKNRKKSDGNLFADSVLEMLQGEMGGVSSKDQMPIWQMFLSFLHVKGHWALVSLLGNNGDTFMGCLKPFTTHLAVIHILGADCIPVGGELGSKPSKIHDDEVHDTCDVGMIDSNRCFGSQTDTSTSVSGELHGDRKMTKSRRRLYQEMTWSSFCKAAFEGSNFDLFELYIVWHYEKSKKLKFLKCWMKQIGNVNPHCLTALSGSNFEETAACNASRLEPPAVKEGAIPVSNSETSETFFNNLSERIQQGLASGMDLQNLAERVVKSSIHWLQHEFESESKSEGQQIRENPDGSCTEAIVDKLVEILLKAPKEMKKMRQDSDPCSLSENIVRVYELQILFRMEIMRSDVSAMLGKSGKQKMLKQICSLFEIIQYLVDGGIHSHVSLYDYIERTIKARYLDELGDIVEKIYVKMDLLPFGDEDETPSLLFNSEDSNQSWRDRYDKHDRCDANLNHSVSTEGESSQPIPNSLNSPRKIGEDEHAQILNEARERRERARRSARFVSKARDLQRVWAPKQPKMMKGKHDPLPNKSKRKDRQTSDYSVVCETPMPGNKRDRLAVGETPNDPGKSTCSVSRALFQDN